MVVRSISDGADNGEIFGKNIGLLRPDLIRAGLVLYSNELSWTRCLNVRIKFSPKIFYKDNGMFQDAKNRGSL